MSFFKNKLSFFSNARMTGFLVVLLAIAPVLGACSGEQGTPGDGSFFSGVDLSGTTVTLATQPLKIVSLAPSNTEIIFALGAGNKLVGVTTFCDYPQEAEAIEKIGELVTIDLEKIIKLGPELVLAGNKILPETRKLLQDAGIAVAVTEGTSIDGMLQSISLIAKLTGTQKNAGEIVTRLKAKIDQVSQKTKGLSKPRVYYIVSFGEYGNWTAGPGSFIDEMIGLAGGENVAKELGQPWGEFSLETLVRLDPAMLLAGKFSGPLGLLASEPGYRDLTAVKAGHISILNDDLIGRPGPRLVDGLIQIAMALHPEAFPQ